MPLDVPRCFCHGSPVDISGEERAELGDRIKAQRERVFGTKKAAYNMAGVNPGTWDKAEAGQPVRGDRLRRIIAILWPSSEGDWQAIPGVGAPTYVAAPGPKLDGGMGEDEALRAIEQMQRDLTAMSERLEQLKKRRP